MTQEIYFNNIYDLDSGIKRVLGDGISTRIFCGDQSMLSIVTKKEWELKKTLIKCWNGQSDLGNFRTQKIYRKADT